jgi:hypothetical protein
VKTLFGAQRQKELLIIKNKQTMPSKLKMWLHLYLPSEKALISMIQRNSFKEEFREIMRGIRTRYLVETSQNYNFLRKNYSDRLVFLKILFWSALVINVFSLIRTLLALTIFKGVDVQIIKKGQSLIYPCIYYANFFLYDFLIICLSPFICFLMLNRDSVFGKTYSAKKEVEKPKEKDQKRAKTLKEEQKEASN